MITDNLREIGLEIAMGNKDLTGENILLIKDQLDFSSMNLIYYPTKELARSVPSKRSVACLDLVTNLWPLTKDQLLTMEQGWLQSMRSKTGVSKDDDKESQLDLISPEILSRIVTLAYFAYTLEQTEVKYNLLYEDKLVLFSVALDGLNLFLKNAILKSNSRSSKTPDGGEKRGKIYYDILVESGIPVGCNGKFLPSPEESLPELFSLLHRDALRPEVYKK